MSVHPGQIWTVSLDPTVANEQRGIRPCIVVSTDAYNQMPIHQALVVPLTTRDRGLPHHIEVVDDGGLTRASWGMCEALRAISTQRFGRLIGTATPTTVTAIADQLRLWLPRAT